MDTLFRSLPDALHHPEDCRVLVIDVSQIDRIDDAIAKLRSLERLVLTGTGAVAFPDELGQMKSIKSVLLQTPMAQLPAFLYELPNLEILELTAADTLQGFNPGGIEQMTALRSLRLSGPSQACLSHLHLFHGVEEIHLSPGFGTDQLDLSGIATLENLRRLVFGAADVPKSITTLAQLEELEIDGFHDLTLPDHLGGLSSLKKLSLRAPIAAFPRQVLALESLEELEIRKATNRNPIELPEVGWDKLSALRVLRILPTITRLPDGFSELQELEELSVELEATDEIPPLIFDFARLRHLRFGVAFDAQIDVSGAPFSRLPQLESLELQVQTAKEFPLEVCQLQRLRELRLRFNSFQAIPDEIEDLTSLESLDLNIACDAIPAGLTKLHRLEKLTLEGSLSQAMPATFPELKNLREITLRGWRFKHLPDGFTSLGDLTELTLSNCSLAELPEDIGAFAGLAKLKGESNELTKLPTAIGELGALTELNVSRNPIEALPRSLGNLKKLERLDISDTRIRALPPEIGELTSLRFLIANRTGLSTLPESLFGLSSLELLQISRAELSSLPASAGTAPALKDLNLSDNRLTSLPESLIDNQVLARLSLNGNEFTQAAMDALATLEARLGYNFQKPRVRKKVAIPETISQERLSEAVVVQLQRLDATLSPPPKVPETVSQEFPFGPFPLPEAIRQITQDLTWPNVTFAGQWSWQEAWMVRLGIGWDPSEYECAYYHPYVGFGEMDGGNYAFLLRLDDPNPGDPVVYRIDHEDSARHDVPQFVWSLSSFLAALTPE